jgi:hypothetical protein
MTAATPSPHELPDDSADALDATGPDALSALPAQDDADVPESIEDDPGEGLFLDDEPLTADDAPPAEGDSFAERLDVHPGDAKG